MNVSYNDIVYYTPEYFHGDSGDHSFCVPFHNTGIIIEFNVNIINITSSSGQIQINISNHTITLSGLSVLFAVTSVNAYCKDQLYITFNPIITTSDWTAVNHFGANIYQLTKSNWYTVQNNTYTVFGSSGTDYFLVPKNYCYIETTQGGSWDTTIYPYYKYKNTPGYYVNTGIGLPSGIVLLYAGYQHDNNINKYAGYDIAQTDINNSNTAPSTAAFTSFPFKYRNFPRFGMEGKGIRLMSDTNNLEEIYYTDDGLAENDLGIPDKSFVVFKENFTHTEDYYFLHDLVDHNLTALFRVSDTCFFFDGKLYAIPANYTLQVSLRHALFQSVSNVLRPITPGDQNGYWVYTGSGTPPYPVMHSVQSVPNITITTNYQYYSFSLPLNSSRQNYTINWVPVENTATTSKIINCDLRISLTRYRGTAATHTLKMTAENRQDFLNTITFNFNDLKAPYYIQSPVSITTNRFTANLQKTWGAGLENVETYMISNVQIGAARLDYIMAPYGSYNFQKPYSSTALTVAMRPAMASGILQSVNNNYNFIPLMDANNSTLAHGDTLSGGRPYIPRAAGQQWTNSYFFNDYLGGQTGPTAEYVTGLGYNLVIDDWDTKAATRKYPQYEWAVSITLIKNS